MNTLEKCIWPCRIHDLSHKVISGAQLAVKYMTKYRHFKTVLLLSIRFFRDLFLDFLKKSNVIVLLEFPGEV